MIDRAGVEAALGELPIESISRRKPRFPQAESILRPTTRGRRTVRQAGLTDAPPLRNLGKAFIGGLSESLGLRDQDFVPNERRSTVTYCYHNCYQSSGGAADCRPGPRNPIRFKKPLAPTRG